MYGRSRSVALILAGPCSLDTTGPGRCVSRGLVVRPGEAEAGNPHGQPPFSDYPQLIRVRPGRLGDVGRELGAEHPAAGAFRADSEQADPGDKPLRTRRADTDVMPGDSGRLVAFGRVHEVSVTGRVAGIPGLEPRLRGPEPLGLPITPYPIVKPCSAGGGGRTRTVHLLGVLLCQLDYARPRLRSRLNWSRSTRPSGGAWSTAHWTSSSPSSPGGGGSFTPCRGSSQPIVPFGFTPAPGSRPSQYPAGDSNPEPAD